MITPSDRRHALQLVLACSLLQVMPSANSQGHASPQGAGQPRLPPWNLEGLDGPLSWSPTAASTRTWLYLDFWASWCGPCRLSFPWMNRMHEQWSAKGLRIVAVTVDRKKEDALSFLRANPAKFEIALDPQAALARSLDVKTMPTSLLVAPDGRIVHRHEGFTASLGDKAAQSIKEALGG
jgi:thiol-disulfide isomerase/thioredoxin